MKIVSRAFFKRFRKFFFDLKIAANIQRHNENDLFCQSNASGFRSDPNQSLGAPRNGDFQRLPGAASVRGFKCAEIVQKGNQE